MQPPENSRSGSAEGTGTTDSLNHKQCETMLQPSRAPEFVRLGYDAAEGGMGQVIGQDQGGRCEQPHAELSGAPCCGCYSVIHNNQALNSGCTINPVRERK